MNEQFRRIRARFSRKKRLGPRTKTKGPRTRKVERDKKRIQEFLGVKVESGSGKSTTKSRVGCNTLSLRGGHE